MKCLKYFFLVGIVIISLSLNTVRTSGESATISLGYLLPDMGQFTNLSGSTINLPNLNGKKVLVVFWATYDANSRKENVMFSNITRKSSSTVDMISVSFDKSKSVLKETIAMDYIDKNSQYYALEGMSSKLMGKSQFDKGFRNCLIDENGVIIKLNIKPEELEQYLN